MNPPVLLYGSLASHRRGRILREAVSAVPSAVLPNSGGVLLEFGEAFQAAEGEQRAKLIEWTRTPGHLLLLIPPFGPAMCDAPVQWRAERIDGAPRGGQGLAEVLASEVGYRLTGNLQTPAIPEATWSDLSVSVGVYRLHPAAGLFAVTTLPLWSLAVLDAGAELEGWLRSLAQLAGESRSQQAPETSPLSADHFGFLVYLLSRAFSDDEQAVDALRSSPTFRISSERGRSLLNDLQGRGLVEGATPTGVAEQMVMQSPYAHYVSALRTVNRE
jgi:hypothetical protein